MGASVHKEYAEPVLAFLFYLEAIFFFPTDPMLILYCIEQPKKGMRYATIATIASVLGGITAYFIGFTLWNIMGQKIIHNSMVNYILTPKLFSYLSNLYRHYAWGAVLVAGFTPVPYKAATLTAGFCKISFGPFVLCSIISRGARFYLLALIISLFGDRIKKSIHTYFNVIVTLTLVIVALTIWWFTSY